MGPTLDDLRDASLADLPDGAAKASGIAVGIAAADAMLALRSTDGASTPVQYTSGTNPGDWQLSSRERGARAAGMGAREDVWNRRWRSVSGESSAIVEHGQVRPRFGRGEGGRNAQQQLTPL